MRLFSRCAAALAALLLPAAAFAQPAGVTVHAVEAPFDDVRQAAADAIINQGFVIDYEARIGDMLNRTAGDVGAAKTVFDKADALQFCSATLSRKAMEADPANIAYCPYVIFVYDLAGDDAKTYVGFRHLDEASAKSPESKAALAEINKLLDTIVKEAAGTP